MLGLEAHLAIPRLPVLSGSFDAIFGGTKEIESETSIFVFSVDIWEPIIIIVRVGFIVKREV